MDTAKWRLKRLTNDRALFERGEVMTKEEYDEEQEQLLEKQTADIQYCGYCGDPVFWGDEHDDMEVCSQCLVKVSDEELEEMGLL